MKSPKFEVEFDKDGHAFDPSQVGAVLAALPDVTDLFVLSHGWNNDMDDARALYENLFTKAEQIRDNGLVSGLDGRKFGVLAVLWPSKKFADEDLIPGGGAASATAENLKALNGVLDRLAQDPARLGQKTTDPVRQAVVKELKQLLPKLEGDKAARREFVLHLRSLVNPSAAHPEDGSDDFFKRDPEELFDGMKTPVVAPAGPAVQAGATSVSSGKSGKSGGAGSGSAAGLGDLLSGIAGAARRLANFTTYYQMKERAGTVGATGLAPVLRQVRQAKPDVRLHLAGHSFGGRVVTAAANGLDPNSPAVTLSLLQAAYSHNGLAQKFDGTHDGFFRRVLSEKRVSGPVIITHTKNDQAVGVAYPLASRIARQQASALGDENDPYGGMGRNGAQHTPERDTAASQLLNVGEDYPFATGKVYNLRADEFIKEHNDVTGHQVAYALLMAARKV
jgi:hypothetical protein